MIQIVDLSFGYQDRILFENVTLSLKQGEKLGFLGRNGSGKSTLFKLILKKELPLSGRIIIPKEYTIGSLDQHIHFSKECVLEEAITALSSQDGTEDYLAKKILIGLGFSEEDFNRPIHLFSGGYQLRIHLAKVLLKKPNLLLLDEPTNYLDIVSMHWLKEYLRTYPGEIILITHDREFMDGVTSQIMGLHRKKIKKIEGKTTDYFEKILQEEELYEKTRQNLDKKKEHLEHFIQRFGAKATKAKQAQSRKKQLSKIPVLEKLNQLEMLDFSFNDASISSQKIEEIQNLHFSYEENKPIIQQFSLEILKGEKIAIIGKNGFGKSTLLKLIGGILEPTDGLITKSPKLEIGYFGQTHIHTLNPSLSVFEEIQLANSLLKVEEVKAICGAMLFSQDLMEKKIQMLSGGEKSRVLLGKILAKPCHLILLDEPTHHLDMESIEALIEAIDRSESAFVIVTHTEDILKRLPLDKIIYCQREQQKIFLGDYAEFLEKNPSIFEQQSFSAPLKQQKGSKDQYLQAKELQAEMKKLEKKIIQAEEELKKIEEKILQKAEAGLKPSLDELKIQTKIQQQIEADFLKLTDLDLIYSKIKLTK